MPEFHLTVPRTARYFQLGDLTPATKTVWLVCHGYGQLAGYFIRHFAPLAGPGTVIIAPEGLSRFYLQGNGGRVGASWMTREDRLTEIEDQVTYLNQLTDTALTQCVPGARLVVLGFSQGTATVSRWLARTGRRPARLVLWAGTFPEDIAPAQATPLLSGLPLTLVVGTADEYINPDRLAAQRQLLEQLGGQPEVLTFSGGHTLNAAVLHQISTTHVASAN